MAASDCSTDDNTRSGATSDLQTSTRNGPKQATNIRGLSRNVTTSVVFKLIEEELSLELQRRGIPPAVWANNKDDMIDRLGDEIRQGTLTDLSREVSLAVLPRLSVAELRQELRQRNITPAPGHSQVDLMKRLCDEMGKEYFSPKASSVSFVNNTRNAPMQEVPAGTEETSEATPSPPVQETPSGGMETVEEGETDYMKLTEAKGTSDVGAQETRDDGQMQKPLAESSSEVIYVDQWNDDPSSSAHKKRKQVQDTDNERSAPTPTKRSNRDEETTTIKNLATTGNSVKQEPHLDDENTSTSKSEEARGTGAGPVSSVPTGMSNAERSGTNSPICFSCPEEGCSYTAQSMGVLQLHWQGKHSGEKRFECDMCDFKTAWSGSLKVHKKRQHPPNVGV